MESKNLNVYTAYTKDYKHIPEIRLKGQWLHEKGFTIGSNILVNIKDNQIIIERNDGKNLS
jgi:hypothetical protein